ncbi:MAG: T9SS type A sorting domain-containing protein, partial [Polaribacter sp.]|nr:T9SS type A sorting domain-containing protein [Polaribacter sp.]
VYPNPTASGSNLKILNLVKGENVITIYNMIGQKIYKTSHLALDNSATINLPELSTGNYILKINNTSKNKSTIKNLIIK